MKRIFLGKPHQSIIDWINGHPYDPPIDPPGPSEDLTKLYYKCEGDSNWQEYKLGTRDIFVNETSVIFFGINFKKLENFNNIREVKLPSKYLKNNEEVNITRIEGNTFFNCSGLTSVTIPDSVTSIGNYAFSGCSGLTSVTIPNSVENIGASAFSRCSSLTSVIIGNGVTNIGFGVFSNCSSLQSIIVADGNPSYKVISGLLLTKDGKILIGATGVLTSTVIPSNVTSIEAWAFSECTNLTSVTIPEGVTSIGMNAFSYCSGLTSVTFVGKTFEQVQNIEDSDENKYYPWGIEDTHIICVA